MNDTSNGVVRLHSDVRIRNVTTSAFELYDARTGLHIEVSQTPSPALCNGGLVSGELAALVLELGFGDQGLSSEDIWHKQYQFREQQGAHERVQRFRSLLKRATNNTAYYRENRARYDHSQVRSFEDIQQVPILTRDDVRGAATRLWSDGIDYAAEIASGRLELVSTSGTTAERLQAIADASLVRVPSNFADIWRVSKVPGTPRTAVITSPDCAGGRCSLVSGELRSRIVHDHTLILPVPRDLFAITKDELAILADEMARFSPQLLLVNPIYAHWIARRASELNVSLPRVAAILSSYQYLSLAQRRAITVLLGAPVFNVYSATELGGCQIGLECQHGHLHVREDHCLVEVVDGGTLSAPGCVGDVIVSTLAATTMPLVRYAVGDLAAFVTHPCSCPMSDWPIIELHGRSCDALWCHERRLTTRVIDTIVGGRSDVDFYSVRQVRRDSVHIEVIPPLRTELDLKHAEAEVAEALGLRITMETVQRLQPAPSLKYPLTRPLASSVSAGERRRAGRSVKRQRFA